MANNITPFSFTVFSDSHSRDGIGDTTDIFFSNVAESVIGGVGDFVVCTGDFNDSRADNCPQGIRDRVDEHFGTSFRWVPVLGNHDIHYNNASSNQLGLEYIRNEWSGDNINQNLREAISDYAYPGPDGCNSTQFYFFHNGMMFIVMNWFWDGTSNPNADEALWEATGETGGAVVDAQITWISELLRSYPRYPKIVFGHTNAFAFSGRHDDYSYLGGNSKENRDRFWLLLEKYNVIAYIHGHTHIQAFDYIDNSYYNGGLVEDSWTYGLSKVPQICSGCMSWVSGGDPVPGGMTVDVSESSVTFNFYKREHASYGSYYLVSSHSVPFSSGSTLYYTQNKPGTTWFDRVDNSKGWTVDFNLTVSDVQNSGSFLNEDNKANGAGIYVNDGTHQEIINFLPQVINFHNGKKNVDIDATQEHDFRITGKEGGLKLFSKSSSQSSYSELANVPFYVAATRSGNAYRPNVFEDSLGNIHAVWMDDGNGIGSVYYSKYENYEWSVPEEVLSADYPLRNPSVIVDRNNVVYVVYECFLSSGSVIGLSFKNNIGWSSSYNTGNGDCKNPKIVFDSKENICTVWESKSEVYPEIYIDIFDTNKLSWNGSSKISNSTYGSYNPSVSSYMDSLFITWTQKDVGSASDITDFYSEIKIAKVNSNTGIRESLSSVSSNGRMPDFSSVLANVSGNIFVAWQDDVSGSYCIYFTVLSPSFDFLYGPTQLNIGHGFSKYPVLSEQSSTGHVYIVWQDSKNEDYVKFVDSGDSDDPSYSSPLYNQEPLEMSLYSAAYINGTLYSSNNSSFDVEISFSDDRNNFYPSVPHSFSQELPILYQSNLSDEYYYVNNLKIMSQVRCAFYNLSRSSPVFNVNIVPEEYSLERDLLLNKDYSTKEIRFGDFSNILNVHYVFKNIRIYTEDAVEPYGVKEISASDFSLDKLTSLDAVVNNYGDIWMVGTCGVYYFINRQGRLLKVGPSEYIPGLDSITKDSPVEEQESEIEALTKFRAISFDKNHNMYIGGDDGIRYSLDPVRGFKILDIGSVKKVICISFDSNNNLFAGTQNGLFIFSIIESDGVILASDITSTYSDVLTQFITSIQLDDNGCVWIGTINGLYRFYRGKFIRFTVSHGLSSNRINDIAIRNTAVRYIATPTGIDKMVGFNIERNIQSDSVLWNNNVKSVLWKNPNILFAGTMNRLNQIIIDDTEETYSVLNYIPNNTQPNSINDFKTFYILSEDEISDTDVMDVYINGNYIHGGYVLGRDLSSSGSPRIIRFETELKNTDIVDIVVRKDLNVIGSFGQTRVEKSIIGDKFIRVEDFAAEENGDDVKLYVVSSGDENEVKVNDSNSSLPYDKIHLDTTPPHFVENAEGLTIVEQIDRSVVKVSISGATDSSEFDVGSGIDRMIVSNYSNFTTNGITEQESVPYSSSYNHNIGSTLEVIVKEFDIENGEGSVISYCDVNELYAATSLPAVLYKYNYTDTVWEELYNYGEENYIDFVSKYNNKIFVGVGHPTSSATIHVYDDVASSSSYSLSHKASLSISESRAYASCVLNGKLYIGSGVGSGNEYSSGMGDGGAVYVYSDGTEQNIDPFITKVVENMDDDVYGLSSVSGGNSLLASTGDNGYVYEVDVENEVAYIIYNGNESLISIASAQYGNNKYIFVGGGSNGIIRRSLSSENSFDISFRTIPSYVSAIHAISIDSDTQLIFASVGSVLYYLTESGSWMWKYTHTEEINDFTYDSNSQVYYIVSSTGITRINPLSQTKTIYLKLIDRAGNESVLTAPHDTSPFVTSITISDLVDFINENRILELDDYGDIQYNLRGDNKFYSADKIEQEKGEYLSEIFDGSNDLVKWQNMSWECTEFHNTQVLIYVRTSTSRNDILSASWTGPFYSSQSSGVDLSAYYGQYIQFRADLISTEKGITPTFHSLTIRAITAESIHFFTTNFVIPSRIKSGIITSQKIVPVSADIVFGINTTNSVDWSEYQEVDENRLFNINQIGTNFRVGIKLISPSRSLVEATTFGEYGPYNSNLYANTVDFDFTNNSGTTNSYHFRISLYEDAGLSHQVYSVYSGDSQDGFSIDGEAIPSTGKEMHPGDEVRVLFTVPGSANISCDQYYFVKIEYVYDEDFVLISNDHSFVSGCTATFIDNIDFDFINNDATSAYYHFRIKFYEDPERINEYKTIFSGNDRDGWFYNDIEIPEEGLSIAPGETVSITYRSTVTDFESDKIYYLTVEAHDGTSYIFASNSYTFQVRDVQSSEACGGYIDVPIVKNFGIMIELDQNEFVTLNI